MVAMTRVRNASPACASRRSPPLHSCRVVGSRSPRLPTCRREAAQDRAPPADSSPPRRGRCRGMRVRRARPEAREHSIVNSRENVSPGRTHAVDFVEKHHDGRIGVAFASFPRNPKRFAIIGFALRVPHAVKRARLDVHEPGPSRASLLPQPVRQRPRDHRLAGARGTDKKRGRSASQTIPPYHVSVSNSSSGRHWELD